MKFNKLHTDSTQSLLDVHFTGYVVAYIINFCVLEKYWQLSPPTAGREIYLLPHITDTITDEIKY